ncbi:MAG: universal stress protein [Methanobrevibacter sp.]|jgi:nucleotide-binding universal stress UspA family protein|nr:universal stress protein [Methanobrevibacter sp.]
MYKKILFTTDGSSYAEKAAEHAKFLAKASGAELVALSVIEINFYIGIPEDDSVKNLKNILRKKAEAVLEDFEKSVNSDGNEVKVTKIISEGSPAANILDTIVTEEIDVAVIGSSGKTGLSRFIIGSVAEKVIKSASCSVLVVH